MGRRGAITVLAMLVMLAAPALGGEPFKLWIEAESYAEQRGSTARSYSMPGASDGRIVDNSWGGRAGDFLRYDFELPRDVAALHVTLKCARATGGWGFRDNEWRLFTFRFPARGKGKHALVIRSLGDGSNVNTDGLFISSEPVTDAHAAKVMKGNGDSADAGTHDKRVPPEDLAKLPPIAFVVQERLGNPDGVVRYHARHVVGRWGCSIRVFDPTAPDDPPRTIYANPKAAIFDMNVSYDAKTLLFTMREGYDDNWHIYEIGADGSGLRQVTRGPYHDFAPAELPGGGLVFVSTRIKSFNMCAQEPSSVLFTARRDGTGIRQITVNTLNDASPQVLPNGQAMYMRWEYVDRDVKWRQSLWTLNPDGTNVQLYFGNTVRDPSVFWQARPVPGRDEVVATFAPHHGWPMGAIGIVTRRHGVETPRGKGYRWITNDYPRIGDNGRLTEWAYRDPFPVALGKGDTRFLVSYGGGVRSRVRRFGIYLLEADGKLGLLIEDRSLSCTYPIPLAPRTRPPVRPRHRRPEGATTGTFLLQDVYIGLGDGVKRGEVKALRIMEQPPKFPENETRFPRNRVYEMSPVMGRRCYHAKRCLGVVPVEADGSAHFTVPALRELYFQALDVEGRAIQSMGSAVNLVPGEKQTCIGCHEDRGMAPLQRTPLAAGRPPDEPVPYDWGGGGNIDFVRIVQPVLDRRCVKCHSGAKPKAGLNLSGDKTRFFNMAYDNIFNRRGLIHTITLTRNDAQVIPPRKAFAYASRLREHVEGTHPKHRDVKLTRDERERVYVWLDSNSNYYGTYARTRPDTRGGRDLWASQWYSKGFLPVYDRHCASCHKRPGGASYPQDSHWINLTHPEESLVLTAHLSKEAGGYGLTKQRKGKSPPVFASADDPVYRALLDAIREGRGQMLAKPRMDMPGAAPKRGPSDWGSWRGTGDPEERAPGNFWDNVGRYSGARPMPLSRRRLPPSCRAKTGPLYRPGVSDRPTADAS
ncbi:MAG: HzsA-related protein [Planctomycetota bacterium]